MSRSDLTKNWLKVAKDPAFPGPEARKVVSCLRKSRIRIRRTPAPVTSPSEPGGNVALKE